MIFSQASSNLIFIFLRMDFINFVIAGLDLLVLSAIELAEICSIIQKDFLDSIS